MSHPLSKYFTLEEVSFSQEAARRGIDNSPGVEVMTALMHSCFELDKVRELLGHPVLVSSGYRCPELNAAMRGAPNSSHMQGLAMDFICPAFGSVRQVFDAIRRSKIEFDQLIAEYGRWVHVGFGPKMRREVLSFNGHGYKEIV